MRARSLVLSLLCLTASCDSSISLGNSRPDLFGRVRIDGKSAAGLTVTATNPFGTYRTTTDVNGDYYFLDVPYGETDVHVVGAPAFVVFDPRGYTVNLDGHEAETNFWGYSAKSITGQVVWEYAPGRSIGVAGVSARMDEPLFIVPNAVSAADGSYRFPNVPGRGAYTVILETLPPGLLFRGTEWAWSYDSERVENGIWHTAHAVYLPSAELDVIVTVDGQPYPAAVHLDTPMPVTDTPRRFDNLPVRILTVSISGFPSSITFDAMAKLVQLRSDERQTVVFTGYTPNGNRPPVVRIISPATNATFSVGTPITFRGSAEDPEDGVLTGNALSWSQTGGAILGRGEALTIGSLAVGQHRIVLRATDSRGNEATANLDVNIVPVTGGRVIGTVTIDDAPIVGMRVDLSTTPVRYAVTNAQGAYVFEDVPPGARVVSIQPVSCTDFPELARPITVAPGVTTAVNFAGREFTYCYGGGYGRRPPRF